MKTVIQFLCSNVNSLADLSDFGSAEIGPIFDDFPHRVQLFRLGSLRNRLDCGVVFDCIRT